MTSDGEYENVERAVSGLIWSELEWQVLMRRELRQIPALIADELMLAFDIHPRPTSSHAPTRADATSPLRPGTKTVVRLVELDQATDTALIELSATRHVSAALTVDTPRGGVVTIHLDAEGAVVAVAITPTTTALPESLRSALNDD